jgi:hypothetical protein
VIRSKTVTVRPLTFDRSAATAHSDATCSSARTGGRARVLACARPRRNLGA